MKNSIYCKTTSKGVHSFYLKTEEGSFFLFYQNYRKGVNDYFKRGVCIEDATNFKRSRTDNALCRTMSKIYMYIKYAEKENGIEVLKQTAKRNQKYGKREMYA